MPQLSLEQQKALDEQKKQCPFCRIISGEIPAKKVYEDDKVIAILDINPATKGHTLVMPKEHYPIMPLIPEEVFSQLFKKTKALSQAIRQGTLTFGDTLFIANGYVAGQQSNHFMLHLIPREDNDGLDQFILKPGTVETDKEQELLRILKHNLPIMLKDRAKLFPLLGKKESTEQQVTYSQDQIIKIIEQNPQLKEIIIKSPQVLKSQLKSHMQLRRLFENADVDAIIKHFNPLYTPEQDAVVVSEEKKEQQQQISDANYEYLLSVLQQNPKVADLLLHNPKEFVEKMEAIPPLKEIFRGADMQKLRALLLQVRGDKNDEIKNEIEEEKDVNDEQKDTREEQQQESGQQELSEAKKENEKDNLDLISRLFK